MKISHRHSALLFFLLFGLVAVAFYFLAGLKKTEKIEEVATMGNQEITNAPTPLSNFFLYEKPIKNASITVPDTEVTISLVDGQASYGSTQDGGDVTLTKIVGGFMTGNKANIFADIAVQSGGTGVFHYISLFDVVEGKATYRSSYFIGDRVNIINITPSLVGTDVYSVTYLDRDAGESFAEDPTVRRNIDLKIKDGVFVEAES